MRYLKLAAILTAVLLGAAAEAHAGYCQTTCTRNWGGGTTCNTYCY